MPVRAVVQRDRYGRLVERNKDVPDASNAAVRQVIEFDHAKLDYLILPLVEACRFHVEQDAGLCALTNGGSEVVRGTRRLEAFFREYVIGPSADRARYEALGVQLPHGILLYGPPGSGKTHAVDRLVAALRRPTFRLDLGEIGSPFIHQTTVSMRKAFEQAKRSAPSLLILEEIDAVAPARGPMSQDHKVEELTEILRMIESAAKNGVLVLATTNRKEALDPALLRTGRFDHSVHVDYPTAEEVELALEGMLKDRPHGRLDLSGAAQSLAGRPMSDAAWVVNEAARLTARAKRDRIEIAELTEALRRLQPL